MNKGVRNAFASAYMLDYVDMKNRRSMLVFCQVYECMELYSYMENIRHLNSLFEQLLGYNYGLGDSMESHVGGSRCVLCFRQTSSSPTWDTFVSRCRRLGKLRFYGMPYLRLTYFHVSSCLK